jgi:ATP-dependent DNA helicase RecQ
VFALAKKGKTWWQIDLHHAAQVTGEPRDRIVAAVNYLEERGDLILQVAGVRHGYRLTQMPGDRAALLNTMAKRFAERERRDIERLGAVLDFASHQGCKTRRLLEYFGEPVEQDCGHCGWCRGHRPGPIIDARAGTLGEREIGVVDQMRDEAHPALRSPRQMARFLCGITSPSASKAKLSRHPMFGAIGYMPFQTLFD